jgi:hypothetical protein
MPELTVYGQALGSNAWNAGANAMGPPDGTTANANVANQGMDIRMNGFSALPDTAVINAVWSGMRCRASVVPSYIGLQCSNSSEGPSAGGDSAEKTWTSTVAGGALIDVENALDAAKFTPAILKNANFILKATKYGTGVGEVDAVWVRVQYSGPPVAVKRRSGSSWVTATPNRWTGSAWQTATVKRFDGSGWV